MIYLVDYENTGAKGLEGYSFLNKEDKIILFHNKTNIINKNFLKELLNICEIETIELVKAGKNGLDFYIGVYVGELVANKCPERIFIVSKDAGYLAVTHYCQEYHHREIFRINSILESLVYREKHFASNNLSKTSKAKLTEISELKESFRKEDCNKELCKAAKIVTKNLELVDIYEEAISPFGLYNGLVHKYGKKEGTRIYHALKESGFKKYMTKED